MIEENCMKIECICGADVSLDTVDGISGRMMIPRHDDAYEQDKECAYSRCVINVPDGYTQDDASLNVLRVTIRQAPKPKPPDPFVDVVQHSWDMVHRGNFTDWSRLAKLTQLTLLDMARHLACKPEFLELISKYGRYSVAVRPVLEAIALTKRMVRD